MSFDPVNYIRDNSAVAATPLVPEIRLHLVNDFSPLWQATEDALKEKSIDAPYWAFAWPGGQALARHVLDHPGLVRGKRVLDMAAGSGIVAIAAAKAGAAAVTACDIDPLAAAAIGLNAAINDAAIEAVTDDLTEGAGEGWDVILAGDVCYQQAMADRVTAWLRARAAAGVLVLIGDPGRAYLPEDGLEEIARLDVPALGAVEDREVRETTIWRIGGGA